MATQKPISIGTLDAVAQALEVTIDHRPRSRAGDLDRLVNARHAALGELVISRILGVAAWTARPEVSFAVYGERGVVDVLAWHAPSASLLVVELKTEIVDVGDLLGTLDRKRRLAPSIAHPLGWHPARVSAWLAIAESMTNRRRIAAHRVTFDAVLPDDGRKVRAWLAEPVGELHALSFVTDGHRVNVRPGFATLRRVSSRPAASGHARPRQSGSRRAPHPQSGSGKT